MVDTLFDCDDEKWLQEQQTLHNIQSNYCRELMDSIHLQFVFLDAQKTITHISSQREPLQVCDVSNQCVLSEERILGLLENVKKNRIGKKFALHHISAFFVDLEPEHIQQFSNSSSSEDSPFLQHFSLWIWNLNIFNSSLTVLVVKILLFYNIFRLCSQSVFLLLFLFFIMSILFTFSYTKFRLLINKRINPF